MIKRKLFFALLVMSGTVLYAQAPTDGLVAYYPFSGNADNAVSNVNHGTVNGATLTADRFGNPNSAYYFDGTGDHIVMSNTSGLDNDTYTYSCWVNAKVLPGLGASGLIMDLGSSSFAGGTRSQLISINNAYSNTTGWRVTSGNTDGSLVGFQNDILPYQGIWYHIVLTRSADLLQLYVNNGLVKSLSISNTTPVYDTPTNIYIGTRAQQSLNQFFNGTIDELRIYNRALSQAEIKALYSEGVCYEYITVTDTLLINLNSVGTSPSPVENTIKIFPNPTHDHITIDAGNLSSLSGYRFKIINSLGQEVANEIFNQQQFYLDLNTWGGNGLYYFQLIDADGNIIDIKKIVLQ
jgi:hypothetical protein